MTFIPQSRFLVLRAGIIADIDRYVPNEGCTAAYSLLLTRKQTNMSDFIDTNTNDDCIDGRGGTDDAERALLFAKRFALSGEYGSSFLKLQISRVHMTIVIQNGIKGEMPSFAKKYDEQDTDSIVPYLKRLH
jgi:hypothetical protein